MNMNIDPDQTARKRLERKLVISGVKRHGRMTKSEKLLRTERQSLYKSHNLPTSTKKLQKVVNQIAGKTVSEALVQLRFSKKRVARDVIKGLEIAQNEAILGRGMGLAGEEAAVSRWNKQREATDAGKPKDTWDYKTSTEDSGVALKKPKVPFFKETTIELKDGCKKVVRDPSEIYIDQAWVGPGESWKSPEFRARGAINMLKHRTTSKSDQHPHVETCVIMHVMHWKHGLAWCERCANISIQVSPSFSRKKRHACASRTKSRRSATTANSGSRYQTDPSPPNDSFACGR